MYYWCRPRHLTLYALVLFFWHVVVPVILLTIVFHYFFRAVARSFEA